MGNYEPGAKPKNPCFRDHNHAGFRVLDPGFWDLCTRSLGGRFGMISDLSSPLRIRTMKIRFSRHESLGSSHVAPVARPTMPHICVQYALVQVCKCTVTPKPGYRLGNCDRGIGGLSLSWPPLSVDGASVHHHARFPQTSLIWASSSDVSTLEKSNGQSQHPHQINQSVRQKRIIWYLQHPKWPQYVESDKTLTVVRHFKDRPTVQAIGRQEKVHHGSDAVDHGRLTDGNLRESPA